MVGLHYLAAALVALPGAFGLLSSAEISSVFTGNVSLTGTMIKLPEWEMAIVTNDTHALFSLNATKLASEVGWMAIGAGTAMVNADVLVAWPSPVNSSHPWTLSHRTAAGHVAPQVASANQSLSTSHFYTLLPHLCSNSTMTPWTAVSWLRPLAMPGYYPSSSTFATIARYKTSFIYASSSHRPVGDDEHAMLAKHDEAHATIEMDLGTEIDLSGELPRSEPGEGESFEAWTSEAWPSPAKNTGHGPLTRRDIILAAHAAIGSIALLFLSPLAILIARYCRRLDIPWFKIHATIQVGAFLMILTAFTLAVAVAGQPHFSNSHSRLGLVIFSLLLAQLAIGMTAHRTPAYLNGAEQGDDGSIALAAIKGKPLIRICHIALGLGITILGWAQIRLGLEEWVQGSDSGRNVPPVVIIIFWILIGVESAEVFLGRFLSEEAAHSKALRSARSSIRNLTSRATSAVTTAAPTRSNSQQSNHQPTAATALSRATTRYEDAPSSPINSRAPSHTSPTMRRSASIFGFGAGGGGNALSPTRLEKGPSQMSEGSHVTFAVPQPFFAVQGGYGRRESDTSTLVGLGVEDGGGKEEDEKEVVAHGRAL